MARLPEFQIPVKSLLQELLEANGHLLLLSPKYHAELAGVGIEYCFGRVKWWFRNKNTMSTESLKSKSLQSFGSDVVTVYHVRKFARSARDYMRAYSWGHTGLEVETAVKKYKRTAAPSIPISSSSASSRMDDLHVYYCSRPNLGYLRVGRELPRPVATRRASYTLAAGALQIGRPVTYTLTLSLFT